MNATVLDEQGKALALYMGCYGIGVTRVVAAAIEQNHDANGIIWPDAIAPFQVVLVPINYQKSARVAEVADALYAQFNAAGIDVRDRPAARADRRDIEAAERYPVAADPAIHNERGLAVSDEADIGAGAAHIERDQVRHAREPRRVNAAGDPACRSGQDGAGREPPGLVSSGAAPFPRARK